MVCKSGVHSVCFFFNPVIEQIFKKINRSLKQVEINYMVQHITHMHTQRKPGLRVVCGCKL